MTVLPVVVLIESLFMKKVDDYIPKDIWKDAKKFVFQIEDNISIYKQFRNFPTSKQSEEADKFIAWWELGRFREFPHSVMLLYESLGDIYKTIGKDDVMNGYEQLQFTLVQLYKILKDNGMIND